MEPKNLLPCSQEFYIWPYSELTHYFFNLPSNFINPSTLRYPKVYLQSGFQKKCADFSYFPCMLHVSFNVSIIIITFGEKHSVWNSFHIFPASCCFCPQHPFSQIQFIYTFLLSNKRRKVWYTLETKLWLCILSLSVVGWDTMLGHWDRNPKRWIFQFT